MMFLQRQNGFTLAELVVFLVIIGLIVGGLVKGRELKENTRIGATIRQIQTIDAAVTGFRDDYGAWPGDIKDPDKRLPSCLTAACRQPGNGDGYIEINDTLITPLYRPAENSESWRFWRHLILTEHLKPFGNEPFPLAASGGMLTIGGYNIPAQGIYKQIAGNYLRLWAQNDPVTPILSSRKAHLLDKKNG